MPWRQWSPYVPVARRRANAFREMHALRKKGTDIQPVEIEGRTIARSFWGKGWCDHLESFSDYENRLPRGRTYVRNGSVCHLSIKPGCVEAIVSGRELYQTVVRIKKLNPAIWKSVKKRCTGQIGSMLELLKGRLSDQVMTVVTDRASGLFPKPSEIGLSCSCPDWAVMCKHVAAVLYGVGSRLDSRPELLFLLRDVDPQELISAELAMPGRVATSDALDDDRLGDVFGIDLDTGGTQPSAPRAHKTKQQRARKRAAPAAIKRNPGPESRGTRVPAKRGIKISKKEENKTATEETRSGATPRIRPTGKSVARLRKQLGSSVANFARQLGVSAACVYRWEAATGRLTLRNRPLAALAKLHAQARRGRSS